MPKHTPEQWPDELRRLPVTLHPDGRKLVNNNLLAGLFRVGESAIRERRRLGKFPPTVWRDGNRHYSDLFAVADAFLDAFPLLVIDPPAQPVTAPADVILASHAPADSGGLTPAVIASGGRQEQRQDAELARMADILEMAAARFESDADAAHALTEAVGTARHLLSEIVSLERESDGQVTALTETVRTQSDQIGRLMEENRRLREASEEASKQRQKSFWDRLLGK